MTRLVIDLQEGFHGADVRIGVDGDTIYDRSGVRTHPITGFADSADVSVSVGVHELIVSVDGAPAVRTSLTVDADCFVGVNIDSGEIITATSPFGYG